MAVFVHGVAHDSRRAGSRSGHRVGAARRRKALSLLPELGRPYMPGRQEILSAASACLLVGCGAMLNGHDTKIALERSSPDVIYVVDGGKVPQAQTTVALSNLEPHTVVALWPDGRSAELAL